MALKFGELARRASGENWYLEKYEKYLFNRDLEREKEFAPQLFGRPDRDRTKNWSASGFGSCPRRQQFTFLGMPKAKYEEKAMNIFANGDYVHIRHQIFGLAGGYIQAVEVPVEIPELNVRGTMDGVLTNGEGLELKSINSYGFGEISTWGAKREHIAQCKAYMMARPDIPAFRVIYENKDTQQLKEFRVERDDNEIAEIREQIILLGEQTASRQFFPMLDECKSERGFPFTGCAYRNICKDAKWPE